MAAASKARAFHTQQVHFIRTLINFSDVDVANRAMLPGLPAGANLIRALTCISTAFNAGTTNTMSIGTTSGGTDILNAAAAGAATGIVSTLAPVGKSLLAADTTYFVTIAMTGTAATAGVAEVILEYVPAL
jgi:hypothetical protein